MSSLSSLSRKGWILYDKGKKGSWRLCDIAAFHTKIQVQRTLPVTVPPWMLCCPRSWWKDPFLSVALDCEVILASGRRSAGIALAIKRTRPQIKVIALLDPKFQRSAFDLIITPQHDGLVAPNVLNIVGGCLGALPKQDLSVPRLPQPYVYVMVGGPNSVFMYSQSMQHQFIKDLKHLEGCYPHVAMTVSRRTPEDFVSRLRSSFPHFHWVDDQHSCYLAHSDYCIVTQDSVSMISEVLSSHTASLSIYPVPSKRPSKFHRFTEYLYERAWARPFALPLHTFSRSRVHAEEDLADRYHQLWT